MDYFKIKKIIADIITEIRENQVINKEIIGSDIFNILEEKCSVLYYPIDDDNKGFHVKRIVKDSVEDFVYINTSKPLNEQVFIAAHELGHVYKVAEKTYQKLENAEGPSVEEAENITNLFAADLLMPEGPLKRLIESYAKNKAGNTSRMRIEDLIYIIVLLMNDFLVPYEAIRRRLIETKILSEPDAKKLLESNSDIARMIDSFSKDQNIYFNRPTNIKTISGIRTMIESIESTDNSNKYLLAKIKKDFDILTNEPVKDSISIQLGDISNE